MVAQKYPNLFRPIKTAHYEVSAAGMVTFKVYDVLGREITERKMPSGCHTISWNAGIWAGGAYVTRLQAGTHSSSTALFLVR